MPFVKTTITADFNCSVERAFKAPMLCDILKVHTGYQFMPKAVKVYKDEDWGQAGKSKEVVFAKSIASPSEMVLKDVVLERKENEYWKIEVSNPSGRLLFFSKFIGEWQVNSKGSSPQITYTYTLVYESGFWTPFAGLFVRLVWKPYMGNVMKNVKRLAESNEVFLYP